MLNITYGKESVNVIGLNNFCLDEILDCGQCFRWTSCDGVWTGVISGRVVRLKGSGDKLCVYDCDKEFFDNVIAPYLDLYYDYEAVHKSVLQDSLLCNAAKFAPGIRILRQQPFETLCSFIISQNNNIPRIKGIVSRLCEGFGEEISDGYYAFPTPDKLSSLSVDDLAPCRAGFRAKYLIDAAKKVADGTVNFDEISALPLDEAREKLTVIYGVGNKVADCVLLYGLGKKDAFPVDVWIGRAMQTLYPEGLPAHMTPYAGVVQQYIFHHIRNSEK